MSLKRVEAMAKGLKRDPYQKMQPVRVKPNVQPVRFVTYYSGAKGPLDECRVEGQAIRNIVLTTRKPGQLSKTI